MENVLVTGGAGYIGSHVVKMLIEKDYNVIVLDNLSTGSIDLLNNKSKNIIGDFGDIQLLRNTFKHNNIDIVMHFAAFSIVNESNKNALKYYKNNVSNTINLLCVMMENKVKNFIFSSSASVYGSPKEMPIKEDTICNPESVYGKTKFIIENILKDCNEINSVVLRYFNAAGSDSDIGEIHNPETHIIPLLMTTNNFKVFGTDYSTPDGTAIRDYIHVNDISNAHILSIQSLDKEYSIYNIGNNSGYSVKQIITKVKEISGRKINIIESDRRDGDPEELIADSTKIKNELGWKPEQSDIETIIKTAWEWHKNEI